VPESRRRRSSGHLASQDDRLDIGLHDSLDTESLGDPIEFVELETLAAPRLGERLKRDVQTDVVP